LAWQARGQEVLLPAIKNIYFLILALNSMLRVWLSFANASSH